jgi:hypothetical protein
VAHAARAVQVDPRDYEICYLHGGRGWVLQAIFSLSIDTIGVSWQGSKISRASPLGRHPLRYFRRNCERQSQSLPVAHLSISVGNA